MCWQVRGFYVLPSSFMIIQLNALFNMAGYLGSPKISGRIFRVLRTDTRNLSEIIETRHFGYPKIRVRVRVTPNYPKPQPCSLQQERRRWLGEGAPRWRLRPATRRPVGASTARRCRLHHWRRWGRRAVRDPVWICAAALSSRSIIPSTRAALAAPVPPLPDLHRWSEVEQRRGILHRRPAMVQAG